MTDHIMTIERYIHDPKGFYTSKVYIDGTYVSTAIHDLFGERNDIVMPLYYEMYHGGQFILLPEMIFCLEQYDKFNSYLIENRIKRLHIKIVENFWFRYPNAVVHTIYETKQSLFQFCKSLFK
jgi:hypothetical protein